MARWGGTGGQGSAFVLLAATSRPERSGSRVGDADRDSDAVGALDARRGGRTLAAARTTGLRLASIDGHDAAWIGSAWTAARARRRARLQSRAVGEGSASAAGADGRAEGRRPSR
jgi:hypothetical protein